MAAVAGPLDRACSTAVSVDIDPGWYEGQLETADAAEQAAVLSHAAAAAPAVTQPASPDATAQQSSQAATAAPAAAARAGSHVPTVLTKLQKWGDYESFGDPVWPTKIIPMKTPLSHEILDNWQLAEAPRHRLTVSTLLEAQRAAGRRVGLLLDLSNHDCLYDIDIPSDVEYLHVQLVAKELPPLEFVREVACAVNNFWAQHPDMYIAVHCAYGFNRTGFVVCSYLIEHCGLTVDQALQSFATARPPGVKHEKFRNELRARYGSNDSSSGGSQTLPVPVPSPQLLQPSSSSGNARLSAAAVAAVGSVGGGSMGVGGSRALSCRSCGSTSSAAAAGWPAADSPGVGSGSVSGAELLLLAGSSPPVPLQVPTAAAAAAAADVSGAVAAPVAAASPPAGDCDCPPAAADADAPRCCCCNAELTPDDTAAAEAACYADNAATAATAAAAPGRAGRASLPRRSLPDFASSNADEATSSSTISCFARSSSTGAACLTPPLPLPLSPLLTPSVSRAMLSSSPALRLPSRCWSSNSVGDNSSIGCSPTSSAADLVTLGTSCFNSSGPDSSAGGVSDTPRNFYSAAAAAERGGSPAGREGVLLSAQWLAGSALERSVSQQREGGSGSGEVLLYGGSIVRGFSGGGCSSSGQEGAVDDDAAEGSGGEEGCFEMDPYTEPQQQQQQQQQYRGFSGHPPTGRQKSVKFQDAVCCEQAAPGCGVVQLPAADLDSLLASVNVTHQQQQQQQQQQSGAQRQVLRQGVAAADSCSCTCHSQQQSAAPGYSIQEGEAGFSVSGSPQAGSRPLLGDSPGVQGLRGRQQYSSEDGVIDPLENESFGRVTSADLLKHIRNLQNAHEAN